jgi:hypothetical protein
MPTNLKRRTTDGKTIAELELGAYHEQMLRDYTQWKAGGGDPMLPERIWVPPLQASSELVAQSVIRRDGSKCALCYCDSGMEENPLECVKVAWHNVRVGQPAEQTGVGTVSVASYSPNLTRSPFA